MKALNIVFFLFASFLFSQNYFYALDTKSEEETTPNQFVGVPNFEEETLFFDSYLLPISRANELQDALNTHGSVRLENGDYSGAPIIMTTGQRLFGHPNVTIVPNITIKNGSTNVRIQNVDATYLLFEAGAEIANCIVKNLADTRLLSTNGELANNTFINLDRCKLNWNASSSGYFRNNRFIKHWIHGQYPQLIIKGNSQTPSYGNVTVWINLLTPEGHALELENLDSHTFLGLDSESWNYTNQSSKAMFNAVDLGEINLVGLTGGNLTNYKTPVFDIEADKLNIFGKITTSRGGGVSTVREGGDVFSINDITESYEMENSASGFDLKAYHSNELISLNGQTISNQIDLPEAETLTRHILGEERTPWERPNIEDIPNPTGSDWSEIRQGEQDQSDFIQNLIDTQGIAELDKGIYYISKTLKLRDDEGIIGKGTGQTVIIGLTDDFPLITAEGDDSATNFTISNLTLQGGQTGLHLKPVAGSRMQVTSIALRFLVFRNQEIGIHLDKFYGLDNNFIDHMNFVDCGIGIYQEIDPTFVSGDTDTLMYIDKTVFYKNQFVNCGTALSMIAGRANNLNAWVNCNFENNDMAVDFRYHNGSFFANCDFTNHDGDAIIKTRASPIGLYSCEFSENSSSAILDVGQIQIEGSYFSDSTNLFTTHNSKKAFILNSELSGSLGRLDSGLLINSTVGSNTNSQPVLINYSNAIPTILLNSQANPYPQLLVKF